MTEYPHLHPAPEKLTGSVKAWSSPLVLPTYEPAEADPNPMFLEKRVFQGSSGRVYPLPFIDRIESTPVDREWTAVFIENEYLRVILLPELGGRIYAAIDKRNGYDCIYRNPVIKPALVGLAGPWISGGIEFNWPQHHRPSTYMPTDWTIETHSDGSQTIWLSEHEPMNRMKGMHGVRLYPGIARFDTVVRLYNRTPMTQTVMWWANAATEVHENYQSFFPADTVRVADHAKRGMSNFPHCSGHYYGINYGERARSGVPAADTPSQFVPTGGYAADDLRWYANIPVPTSYMCVDSEGSFFGGYDHVAKAGLVHVADRQKSPGKKQWTWGNHTFGYAWDRNLTKPNKDGIYPPYIELMAGVYTDNQPDFSFLAPGETKTFTQHWYPLGDIGPASGASAELAVNVTLNDGIVKIALQAIEPLKGLEIELKASGIALDKRVVDIDPQLTHTYSISAPTVKNEKQLQLVAIASYGKTLFRIGEQVEPLDEPTEAATEPPLPCDIESVEELFLTGLHLEQYRHATRSPEAYWQEALRRDPNDSRSNNALGLWHLRRGEFAHAERCFKTAIKRLRIRNPNPYDGEALYNLGLTLRLRGKHDQAYKMFGKASWNAAWFAPSNFAMAEIDMVRGSLNNAIDHVNEVLRCDSENLKALTLKALCLRIFGQTEQANYLFEEILKLDPLDNWARHAMSQTLSCDPYVILDLAIDYDRIGLTGEALCLLVSSKQPVSAGAEPLRYYYAAWLADKLGEHDKATAFRKAAKQADPAYCFPSRIEEIIILQAAIEADNEDARARYYLGNLLYDKRRHHEAIICWESSSKLDPSFAITWRNLGISYFNNLANIDKALRAYDQAVACAPTDARVFFERDQLWKRVGVAPDKRLEALEAHLDLVSNRDDLSIELIALYLQCGRAKCAIEKLLGREFQPWEGGEGLVLEQYVRARLKLGGQALERGEHGKARDEFISALSPPPNLGEAAHPLANQSDLHYWIGVACEEMGDLSTASGYWEAAANFRGDFLDMEVRAFSEKTYYSILSLERLGQYAEANTLCSALEGYAQKLLTQTAKIDYFATSLPTMLLFEDDIQKRQDLSAWIMLGQVSMIRKDWKQARHWLKKALAGDPNHALAADLLSRIKEQSLQMAI